MRISEQEFAGRREQLASRLAERGLAGAVLFDPYYVLYYAGFAFIPTERPIAFAVSAEGEPAMLVPRLEVEHARAHTGIERDRPLRRVPGRPARRGRRCAELLADMGIAGQIGADQDGYPWILGYQGPSLSELTSAEVVRVAPFVEAQMAVKSEAELALIRESAKWGNLAHRCCSSTRGRALTETEVTHARRDEATTAMLQTLGPLYRGQNPLAPRRARRLPRPDRARLGDPACAREQRRLPGGRRARHRARARPCGAISPSSSGRW